MADGSSLGSKTPKGSATMARILDAAAALFAERGFKGAAMRDVAELAGVEQGLISYYFKSKEVLFRQALERCSIETLGLQSAALEQLLAQSGARSPTVEAILHTYTESALDPLSRGDRRFVHTVKLSAQYAQLDKPQLYSPILKIYGPVRRRYIEALQSALPAFTSEEVRWGFNVFEAAYMHLILDHSKRASEGVEISATQVNELRQRLAAFCAAGFAGLHRCG